MKGLLFNTIRTLCDINYALFVLLWVPTPRGVRVPKFARNVNRNIIVIIVIPFHSTYTTWTIVVVFFFCLAVSFLLFGHFCMFCIFRYLCVTVYIQVFSFRAASVCLINSVVSCQKCSHIIAVNTVLWMRAFC